MLQINGLVFNQDFLETKTEDAPRNQEREGKKMEPRASDGIPPEVGGLSGGGGLHFAGVGVRIDELEEPTI